MHKNLESVHTSSIAEYMELQMAKDQAKGALNHPISREQLDEAFDTWLGCSAEAFLMYACKTYNAQLLSGQTAIFHGSAEHDVSQKWRHHDNFIRIAAENLSNDYPKIVQYSLFSTAFGKMLVASTESGICHLALGEDENALTAELILRFPCSNITAVTSSEHHKVLQVLQHPEKALEHSLSLDLQGTAFQKEVWATLLRIPFGHLLTYTQVAKKMNAPAAVRAVASAIGNNPIAWLIPCHRVVRNDGDYGGFKWGLPRKAMIIGWEAWHIRQAHHKTIPN